MIKTFEGYFGINEDVNTAKSWLLKNAAKNSRRYKEGGKVTFTAEEEKKILNDPRYTEIRDYLIKINKPGLIYPFTYFIIEEKLPRFNQKDSDGNYDKRAFTVENLLDLYLQASANFSIFPLPLGNINNYIKNKELEKSNIPAYEVLFSDLGNILSMKELKGFVDKIASRDVRNEFKRAVQLGDKDPVMKALLDDLYSSYTSFKNLSPKKDSKGNLHTPESGIIDKSQKYADTYNLYNFKNPQERFSMFVDDCRKKVEGWNTGIEDFIIEIENISPSIKLLYSDPISKVVVTSARSARGMEEVCKISNADLCILSPANFWTITGGHLQISINMMDLSKMDLKYLTTFTVAPSGRIKEARTRVNMQAPQPCKPGEDYRDFIPRYLPEIDHEEVVKSIERNFQVELAIKNLLQSIEQKSNNKDIKYLLLLLGSLEVQRSVEAGDYTREEMEEYRDIIVEILLREKNISYKEIVETFKSPNGLFMAKEDVDLFKIITEDKYNIEDALSIIDLTKEGIQSLGEFLSQVESSEDSNTIRLAKYLIEASPEIMEYAERRLLNK